MAKMTIAQALRKVKKLKGDLADLNAKVKMGCTFEKTKVPAFSFSDSYKKFKETSQELIELQSKIAIANSKNSIKVDKRSISLALAARETQEIRSEISLLKELLIRNEVVKTPDRNWDEITEKYVLKITETEYVSSLSEIERDTMIKELEAKYESINNALESANHSVTV